MQEALCNQVILFAQREARSRCARPRKTWSMATKQINCSNVQRCLCSRVHSLIAVGLNGGQMLSEVGLNASVARFAQGCPGLKLFMDLDGLGCFEEC